MIRDERSAEPANGANYRVFFANFAAERANGSAPFRAGRYLF
jgi:hypothetical protein